MLVVTSDDGLAPRRRGPGQGGGGAGRRTQVTRAHFTTDHGHDDQRVALTSAVQRWLEALPGAPAAR
ncbi:MAG TPA: hypothetical protein VHY34_09210 [Caulobacteraceae bacterium]|nr:hypothetical protein [Caulobacteraceae bacterium]